MAKRPARRVKGSGAVRQLPSRRWQARYRRDDGSLVAAPLTFDTKLDASTWLADQDGDPVVEKRPLYRLDEYAVQWLAGRDLKPRTRAGYGEMLDALILPSLGAVPLGTLSPARVRAWYGKLDATTPTRRSHAYLLLHAIMATATADDLIDANPCRIRRAGWAARRHQTKVATLAELEIIVGAMPSRYRSMVLLAAWCGLRFGELTELRRGDVDLDAGLLRIRRGVVSVRGQFIVGDPKTAAGKRDVAIPPHLMRGLVEHLCTHGGAESNALLFPARGGGHMAASSLYTVWYSAGGSWAA